MCAAFTLEKGLPCNLHGMKINATLNQKQNLSLTPQLQQAIKLLQMSAQELNSYVDQQAMENPLLEWQGDLSDNAPASEIEHGSLTKEAAENIWQSDLPPYAKSNSGSSSTADIMQTIAAQQSLRESLLSQAMIVCPDVNSSIIEILIDGLDERGYYIEDIESVAKQRNIDEKKLKVALECMKSCEPAGIFSQNVSECFRTQLQDQSMLTEAAERVLKSLPLLESHGIAELVTQTGLEEQSCLQVLQQLRRLEPKPASQFTNAENPTVVSDLILARGDDKQWRVFLNPEVTPKIIVNSEFYNAVNSSRTKVSDWKYIQQQYSNANWLVKALQQRFTTLIKVAEQLIDTQYEFFEKGPEAIKPLVLRQVAEACGIHESTVSRTVRDKYIATPRGVFELGYFFSSSTKNSNDKHGSSRSIQQKIKAIIKLEPKEKPYSDDSMVKILKAQGIDVARRTVTKYRELLHIVSSVERKRQYKQDAIFRK